MYVSGNGVGVGVGVGVLAGVAVGVDVGEGDGEAVGSGAGLIGLSHPAARRASANGKTRMRERESFPMRNRYR